jgi:hypothetical protein
MNRRRRNKTEIRRNCESAGNPKNTPVVWGEYPEDNQASRHARKLKNPPRLTRILEKDMVPMVAKGRRAARKPSWVTGGKNSR